jgi:hypothetical protein
MKTSVHSAITNLLTEKLVAIEKHRQCDVLSYHGPIFDHSDRFMLNLIENLAQDANKRDRLMIILTTSGGSAFAVERYVSIIRHYYQTVDFVVPNYAYSAGTVFCMSGDNILMDYSSALGPIDPQVQNREGKWVAALGYLDKVNEAIEKSRNDTLTEIEFLMIQDLDLAELREYEQARQLTNELLKKWLANYKFKNWSIHETSPEILGQPVTFEQKQQRAQDIANKLNDNTHWKSHSRPINIEALHKLGLKIEDYSNDPIFRPLVRDYYDLLADYFAINNFTIFVQTRKFISNE